MEVGEVPSYLHRGSGLSRITIRLILSLFFVLLISGLIVQTSDLSPYTQTITPTSPEKMVRQPSAIQQNLFPIGSYSFGSWTWAQQDPHGHATNHGNEFSMGQDQYSPFLCMEIVDERYTGWFYSGAVSYSGPSLNSLTTRIDVRTAWSQNTGDDGNGYYEIDLKVQKFVLGSWIDKGTWNNAWTYTGKTTNPGDQIKSDWGSGVVDGPGQYRLAVYMVVDGPSTGCTDSFWLYIEDFALYGEDNEPPVWNPSPTDQIVEYGSDFRYDLNATDSAGIDHWWINASSQFTIDGSGVITNNSLLSIGSYGIDVRVYDTQTNYQTGTFKVTVQDTTGPQWLQQPIDQEFVLGLPFDYNVNASDLSGINSYWVNDTSNFVIDGSGVVSNNTVLLEAIYGLEIRAYDPHSNYISANITIFAVNADPVWDEIPVDQLMEFGSFFQYDLNASAYFGIESYWLNDTSFFSINLDGVLTNVSQISVGVRRLEVRAYDPDSRYASAFLIITCEDTTSPEWIETPDNLVNEYGSPISYKLNVTDLSGLAQWWINDTLHFAIDSSGVLTNIGFSIGNFGIQVWVNDTQGNILTGEFSILVRDTTPPSWLLLPTDQEISQSEPLDYQLSVTDLSGIAEFAINDTVHFSITSQGRITSIGLPETGEYGIRVTVFDIFGNSVSAEFTVVILPSTTPIPPPDLLSSFILVFSGAAATLVIITVVNIYLKKRGD